jgi:hypothetical protein
VGLDCLIAIGPEVADVGRSVAAAAVAAVVVVAVEVDAVVAVVAVGWDQISQRKGWV